MTNEIKIGIINLMPKAEEYEHNLLVPLNKSSLKVTLVFIRLKNHCYSSSNKEHLKKCYKYFEDVKDKLQGLILSPAPVEEIPFEKITYWEELKKILGYARKNYASTLGLCWGGLALAKLLDIKKTMFKKKLFGIYKTTKLDSKHIIMRDLDDEFYCPHSRHAGINDNLLEQTSNKGIINLLAYSQDAGYYIFESCDKKFLINLGHPEYHTTRLVEEYIRDKNKGRTDVRPPENLHIDSPVNNWKLNGQEFFGGWTKSIFEAGS